MRLVAIRCDGRTYERMSPQGQRRRWSVGAPARAYLPFVTVLAVIADAAPHRTGAGTMAGSTGASARR